MLKLGKKGRSNIGRGENASISLDLEPYIVQLIYKMSKKVFGQLNIRFGKRGRGATNNQINYIKETLGFWLFIDINSEKLADFAPLTNLV